MTRGMLLDAGWWISFHVRFCPGLSLALGFSPLLLAQKKENSKEKQNCLSFKKKFKLVSSDQISL